MNPPITTDLDASSVSDPPDITMAEAWERLVAAAMLGSDRRDPPEPVPSIADAVDDTLRSTPSERMLAQVAAMVAVRRAGVLPGPALARIAPPDRDDRPICPLAATERWHHVTTSWPVLEDEWMLTLIVNGWRLAPELVPDVLARHRRDAIRRTRAEVAAGPLGTWLVDHLPEFASPAAPGPAPAAESIAELPPLPIPADLEPLLHASGPETARALVAGITSAALAHSHRAVLVNLIARMQPDALADVATALDRVDAASIGFPLASVLADLARTRRRMLDELEN